MRPDNRPGRLASVTYDDADACDTGGCSPVQAANGWTPNLLRRSCPSSGRLRWAGSQQLAPRERPFQTTSRALYLRCVRSYEGSQPPPTDAGQSLCSPPRGFHIRRKSIRQHAEQQLIQAGAGAIEVLERTLSGQEVEGSLRGLAVLRELAMQRDTRVSAAAERVIETLAENQVTATSHRADAMLRSLRDLRSQRGLRILKQLGARIRFVNETVEEGLLVRNMGSSLAFLTFGDAWHGDPSDLLFVGWLTDYRGCKLTFDGKQFTDAYLQAIKQDERVVGLQLKRTSMTDAGLEQTKSMTGLKTVVLQYCEFTSASLQHLDRNPPLDLLYVFGGAIPKSDFDDFARQPKHKDHTLTRYGRGGFLGISGSPFVSDDGSVKGCQVETVSAGHAAERAGIRKNDIITKYQGRAVTTFVPATNAGVIPSDGLPSDSEPSLAELIGENLPGDRVTVTLLRGGVALELDVELGDWP